MMNPGAIMGNMQAQGQIMGGNMRQQMLEAETAASAGRGRRLAIEGGGASRGGRATGTGAASEALVPVGNQGGQTSLLDLFNTPHGFGGGHSGGAA